MKMRMHLPRTEVARLMRLAYADIQDKLKLLYFWKEATSPSTGQR